MPTYQVKDPVSGKTLRLTGDSPPTEEELQAIFSSRSTAALATPKKESVPAEVKKEDKSGGFLSNALRDAGDITSGVYNMIRHPIDTASGLGKLAIGGSGAIQKELGLLDRNVPIEGEEAARSLAAPFVKGYNNPSGIPSQLANYAYNKPLSAAMDLSGVLGIAGKAAKVGGAAKLAQGLQSASSAIDPMSQGINAVGAISKKVSPFIPKVRNELFGISTGAGPAAIERAVEGTPAFKEGLRGKITGDQIVDGARSALEKIQAKRGADYRKQLEEITEQANTRGSAAANIDVTPINKKLEELYRDFNVKRLGNTGADPNFDTTRIPMGKKGRRDINEILETVATWGKAKGDFSAIGLDTLKRQLDDFYSDSSQARRFVADLRDTVHKTISEAVPEYAVMTNGYEEASTLIKNIQKTLMLQSGNSQRTADQVLRRLTSAMHERFELRKDLIDVLGQKGAANLTDAVAGHAMSNVMPKGLVSRIHMGGVAALAHLVNPMLWPALAAASPRVMGEFLSGYGRLLNYGKRVKAKLPSMPDIPVPNIPTSALTQGAFQTQRLVPEEK